MIDLGLSQNKIKEIKYEIKEGKTVIFKLNNSNLEDVEIIEEEIKTKDETIEEESKDFNLNEIMRTTKPKQLNDYEPFSCLKGEKGMQETLEASRNKYWKDDVLKNELIIPVDTIPTTTKSESENSNASLNEISKFKKEQKIKDLKENIKYRDKIEKKLAKDLINSKKLIDDYTAKMSAVEKERFSNRIQDKYFKLDPNDEFSKIKSLNDLNNLNVNYSSLSSYEAKMKPISGTKTNNRNREGLDKIIKAFKQED